MQFIKMYNLNINKKGFISMLTISRLRLLPMLNHPMRELMEKRSHKLVTKYTEQYVSVWYPGERHHSITDSVKLYKGVLLSICRQAGLNIMTSKCLNPTNNKVLAALWHW